MTKEDQTPKVSGAMTDAEILAIYKRVINDQGKSLFEFARAIESALLSRAQDAQAVRNAALEEAAQLCDAQFEKDKPHQISGNQCDNYMTGYSDGSGDCAHAIRALQSAPALGTGLPTSCGRCGCNRGPSWLNTNTSRT